MANVNLLVIDEAQNIPDIGKILKLIVDSINGIKNIATGSSVFDLSNKLGEPLVGRKNTIYLFPLAQMEFANHENYKETTQKLEERLLFGSGCTTKIRYAAILAIFLTLSQSSLL